MGFGDGNCREVVHVRESQLQSPVEGIVATTIFERYGGFATVRKVVVEFYDRILDEAQLAAFFADTNMQRLIEHQTQFISAVMGGPSSTTDEQLYRSHANLNISADDFNLVAAILEETLEDFDVEGDDVRHIMQGVKGKEPFIVGKSNAA